MISKRVPDFAIEKVVNTCFPLDKTDHRLPVALATDAYDNLSKAKNIKGMYFVIWGEDDAMMPPAFAKRLFESHYEGVIEEAKTLPDNAPITRVKELLYKLGLEFREFKGDEEAAMRKRLKERVPAVDLEALASKRTCRVAHGEHGCFFGDDPAASRLLCEPLPSPYPTT